MSTTARTSRVVTVAATAGFLLLAPTATALSAGSGAALAITSQTVTAPTPAGQVLAPAAQAVRDDAHWG